MSVQINLIRNRIVPWRHIFCAACQGQMVHLFQPCDRSGEVNHLFVCPECGREVGFTSVKDNGPPTVKGGGLRVRSGRESEKS